MTCICVLTAFRPSFPHLETFKKNIGKLNSLTVRKKKKKKQSRPTDPIFKFWSGEGNITIFFFWPYKIISGIGVEPLVSVPQTHLPRM